MASERIECLMTSTMSNPSEGRSRVKSLYICSREQAVAGIRSIDRPTPKETLLKLRLSRNSASMLQGCERYRTDL